MLKKSCLFLTFFLIICVSAFSESQNYRLVKIEFPEKIVSRESTILRELEFTLGSQYNKISLDSLLKNSEKNLLNTALFNFVTLTPKYIGDQVIVKIELIERWYIWPYPLFEIADRNINSWLVEKDFSRLNYGMFLVWDNFTGRKDKLKILIRLGHEDKFGIYYKLPALNTKKTLGFDMGISFGQKYELGVASVKDKLVYFRDSSDYARKEFKSFVSFIYRPQIHKSSSIKLEYANTQFSDSLISNYPNYTINSKKNLSYFSLSLRYISDFRDYIFYPLKGHYFDVEIERKGFGIIQSEGVGFFTIKAKFNLYQQISDRWYYAFGLSTKFSSDDVQPYQLQRGLGYFKDYVRAYELYVLDGKNYGLFKSNLKFELVPRKLHSFNFMRNEKFDKLFYAFYINLFADAAYVKDLNYKQFNTLTNELNFSYGIGFDFVTYYDIVFRMEYSRNKQNEGFLFFHLMASI